MDIKIENNKIQIADISAFTKKTIYSVSELKDSVTFIFNDKIRQTIIVRETSVNGTQMTADNIDKLLSPLFSVSDNGSSPNTQTSAYTKIEYSDPLIFPTAERSGHIAEVYKDGALYQSYQWNGWDWAIMGAKPNFIFTQGDSMPSMLGNNVLFTHKEGNVYKLSLDKNSDYSNVQIYAKDIKLASKEFMLGAISITPDPHSSLDLSDLNIDNLQIMSKTGIIDDITENFSLKNCIVSSANIGLITKKTFIDNIKYPDNTIGQNAINSTSLNTTITNTMTDNISAYCIQVDKTKPSDTVINISDNISLSGNMGINISGSVDGNTKTNCDITIKDNVGLTDLRITSFGNESKINSFTGDFDKALNSVSISDCDLTQTAFDMFITALSNVPNTENLAKNLNLYNVTPALSEAQKTSLTNAGWSIM